MKKQHGFAIVETIVVFVIVAAIVLAGLWVWQRNQAKATKSGDNAAITKDDDMAKGSLGKGCTAGDMKGKLYTAPKAVYAICIPNGWKLYGPSNGAALIGTDLAYIKETVPQVDIITGGGDGVSVFSVFYNTPAAGAPTNYNTVGPFAADNVTGTEYARTQTKDSHQEGLGVVQKGTIQHAYYFEHAGKSVEVDYNLMPNDNDYTAEAAAVAKTLIFN